MSNRAGLPGLQAERTALAWDRTALGLLANGALLLLRDSGSPGPARLVAAGWAAGMAAATASVGQARARRITGTRAADAVASPTVAPRMVEVKLLGVGVAVLGLVDVLAILTG